MRVQEQLPRVVIDTVNGRNPGILQLTELSPVQSQTKKIAPRSDPIYPRKKSNLGFIRIHHASFPASWAYVVARAWRRERLLSSLHEWM